MGYQRGDVAIVIAWEVTAEFSARMSAINRGWGERDIITASGPHVNGYRTWVFNYDGSKEGWAESERADDLREEFIRAARECLPWPHIARVCVGLDEESDYWISRVVCDEDEF